MCSPKLAERADCGNASGPELTFFICKKYVNLWFTGTSLRSRKAMKVITVSACSLSLSLPIAANLGKGALFSTSVMSYSATEIDGLTFNLLMPRMQYSFYKYDFHPFICVLQLRRFHSKRSHLHGKWHFSPSNWIPFPANFLLQRVSVIKIVLMQGGKEAAHSNALLHKIITDTIARVAPDVGPELVGLVTSRQGVDDLLQLDDVIDLVKISLKILSIPSAFIRLLPLLIPKSWLHRLHKILRQDLHYNYVSCKFFEKYQDLSCQPTLDSSSWTHIKRFTP